MIRHPAFSVGEWTVTETAFSPEILAQAETVFTVANGYLGLRGNLEEAAPVEFPGTYLNGFYESRPIAFEQEPPSSRVPMSETTLNVTDGKVIRLLVNGAPLDVRTGRLFSHVRVLDMAAAMLTRELVWGGPNGGVIRLRTERLASLAMPQLAAISYRVEALEGKAELEITSSLVANESTQVREDDPRAAAPLYGQVLLRRFVEAAGSRLVAGHTTRTSRLNLVTAAEHLFEADPAAHVETFEGSGEINIVYQLALEEGSAATLTKFLAYAWSAEESIGELTRSASTVLDQARAVGYRGLLESQRDAASRFWERCDVVLDGDAEVQQGVRFGLYQLMQAAAHAGGRGIAAKGLTGQGYDGHRFWEGEAFLVPIMAHTMPTWARDVLRFRIRTLDAARARAQQLGLKGALYPWRTITGADVSSYFPEGMAAYHLAADIACALDAYIRASGDEDFLADGGAELLVETARLWLSLGHFDQRRGGAFCIDEVTGPDEYSALVDNNAYTNLMAAQNLALAANCVRDLAARRPEVHAALVQATALGSEEPARWEQAARAMYVPFDSELGIHAQDDAFLHHAVFDLDAVPKDHYPLLLYYHPLTLYRRQVVKQADLVLALWSVGDRFSIEEKRKVFDYYEPITVHDSSLSAASHAIVAAEIGRVDVAMRYVRDAALIDLDNLALNVRDGVHLAGVASSWLAIVAGLAGFRHRSNGVSFTPCLATGIRRLAFPLSFGAVHLSVEITPTNTRYRLSEGDFFTFEHHGQVIVLSGAGSERTVSTQGFRVEPTPASRLKRLLRAVGSPQWPRVRLRRR